jgi:hypothetical protein
MVEAEARCVKFALFHSQQSHLSYQGIITVRAWLFDTAEHREIWGTTLGKGVGALVLGTFPWGTKRITQILPWTHREDLQVRFEIGDFEARDAFEQELENTEE